MILNFLRMVFPIVFTLLGVFIGLLQILSVRGISSLLNTLTSRLKRALPFLSSQLLRKIMFVVIVSLLVGTFINLASFALTTSNSPTPTKPPASDFLTYTSNTDLPNFTTKLQWDKSVIVNHSLSIALNMLPNNNSKAIRTLSQKFGPSYTLFIVTQLDIDGSTFTAVPKDQVQQPIEQGTLSFHWIATPLHSGDQAVDVIVNAIWIPTNSNGKQIEYYLGSHIWHISVADDSLPPIILGQVNVFQALSYLASVFVSVAFIQLVITGIGNRKQVTNQDAQPPAHQLSPPQSPPTQPTVTQPAPAQSSAVQPTSNQPPAAQSPIANNQQNTQQPVP